MAVKRPRRHKDSCAVWQILQRPSTPYGTMKHSRTDTSLQTAGESSYLRIGQSADSYDKDHYPTSLCRVSGIGRASQGALPLPLIRQVARDANLFVRNIDLHHWQPQACAASTGQSRASTGQSRGCACLCDSRGRSIEQLGGRARSKRTP